MKNLKRSTVVFIILNIIGMAAFISIAYSSWNSAEKLNSINVESSLLGTQIEASKAKITELENKINEALTEGNKLKTMRMNKFSYFASEFVKNMFTSPAYFAANCEPMIISSDISGDKYVLPEAEFRELSYFGGNNKKVKIENNMIYLYEWSPDFESDLGVQLHFRKDASGKWKLAKIVYEGC